MEICARCNQHQRLAWSVKDSVWKKVVGTDQRVLCMECFLFKAKQKKVVVVLRDILFLGTENSVWIDKRKERGDADKSTS